MTPARPNLPILTTLTLLFPGVAAALAGCAFGGAHPGEPGSPGAVFLRPRARLAASAAEPHAAALSGTEAVVVWGAVREDGGADIFLALINGRDRGKAALVNPVPGTAVAGRQVGPRVAVAGGGRILVAWVDRGLDPAGDILIGSSADGGRSFASPLRVNDDGPPSAGQEYPAMAILPGGRVVIAWLDERDAPGERPNEKQLYFALSTDGGRTFGPNRRVTRSPRGVCPCCRPALHAGPGGVLHAVYRDREGGGLVIRTARLEPGEESFREPVTVSGPPWRFDACPVDGPAVLAGPGGRVRVAWMDGALGEETLRQSLSEDGGRTFGHALALLPARSLEANASLQVNVPRLAAHHEGSAPAPSGIGEGGDSGSGCCLDGGVSPDGLPGRPVLAEHPGLGVIAAWEDSAGGVWILPLGEKRTGAGPLLVAGGGPAWAGSPALAVDGARRVHVFWTEASVDVAEPDGRPPPSSLGHAVLMEDGRGLTLLTPGQHALTRRAEDAP